MPRFNHTMKYDDRYWHSFGQDADDIFANDDIDAVLSMVHQCMIDKNFLGGPMKNRNEPGVTNDRRYIVELNRELRLTPELRSHQISRTLHFDELHYNAMAHSVMLRERPSDDDLVAADLLEEHGFDEQAKVLRNTRLKEQPHRPRTNLWGTTAASSGPQYHVE